MQQPAPVTPELFWDTIWAFQRTAAMKAAIELEIFTTVSKGNTTAETIAKTSGAVERGVRILCDSLTVMGFLNKNGADYALTDVSAAFLDKGAPAYLGGTIDFILSPQQKRGYDGLTQAVRLGGSPTTGDDSLDPESPMWVTFARGMLPMMMPNAQLMAEHVDADADRKLKVLDIAAGHGIFGISFARKFHNAEIYALDWANVLAVATENAEKFGVSDRYHLIPGSAFDADIGTGYDLVLLTNFLHHFDVATCENLLRKINGSLAEGGKVLTLEFVPNDDRVSPPAEAMFSLVMLAGTPAGDAYTFAELKQMFENAGFAHNEHIPLPPTPQHLIISSK